MSGSLRDDASMHRLWYDLRNQGLSDAELTPVIQVIDGLLSHDLAGRDALRRRARRG